MLILIDELYGAANQYLKSLNQLKQLERDLRDGKSQLNKELFFYRLFDELTIYLKQERQRLLDEEVYIERLIWEVEEAWKKEIAEEKTRKQAEQFHEISKSPIDYIQKLQQIETAHKEMKILFDKLKEHEDKLTSLIMKVVEEKQKIIFPGYKTRLRVLREARDNMIEQDLPIATISEINRLLNENEQLERLIEKSDLMDFPHKYLKELNDVGVMVNAEMSEIEIKAKILATVEANIKELDLLMNDKIENYAKKVDVVKEREDLAKIDMKFSQEAALILKDIREIRNEIKQNRDKIEDITGKKVEISLDFESGKDPFINGFLDKFINTTLLSDEKKNSNDLDNSSHPRSPLGNGK